MPRTRAPAGCNKHILIRFTESERLALEHQAAIANMTLAATARHMTLCGMAHMSTEPDAKAAQGVAGHE